MTRRTSRTLFVALALAASLVACGGEADDDPTLTQPTESAAPTLGPTQAPAEAAEPEPCESRAASAEPPAGAVTDLGTKPSVQPNDAPPPCGLVVQDIVIGEGPEPQVSDTVQVKYVGAFYETGQEFDSSWGSAPDDTIEFPLNQVVPGFSQGIAGMKVGGRRQITVPSELGYGAQGQGPIPPNSTLVFVVDLVGIANG
jgi:FKBP-type peptidyl-prolyl cis-trans isomerase